MDTTARSLTERRAAAVERLQAGGNLWLATAGDRRPHLIPVSFWWDGTRLTTATFDGSRTLTNVRDRPEVRASLDDTTDVLMVDATAEAVAVADIEPAAADGYVRSSNIDPRTVPGFVFLRLTPRRIQVWRGPAEFAGRTVMRRGAWLTEPVD